MKPLHLVFAAILSILFINLPAFACGEGGCDPEPPKVEEPKPEPKPPEIPTKSSDDRDPTPITAQPEWMPCRILPDGRIAYHVEAQLRLLYGKAKATKRTIEYCQSLPLSKIPKAKHWQGKN